VLQQKNGFSDSEKALAGSMDRMHLSGTSTIAPGLAAGRYGVEVRFRCDVERRSESGRRGITGVLIDQKRGFSTLLTE